MKKLKELNDKYGDFFVKDEDALINLLEQPKPRTIHDLNIGDRYWYIDEFGIVRSTKYNNSYNDELRKSCRNMYLSKEDAEFYQNYKIVILEIKDLGGTTNLKKLFEHHKVVYFFRYPHKKDPEILIGKLELDNFAEKNYQMQGTFYFSSAQDALNALHKIGKEKIIKYLF